MCSVFVDNFSYIRRSESIIAESEEKRSVAAVAAHHAAGAGSAGLGGGISAVSPCGRATSSRYS